MIKILYVHGYNGKSNGESFQKLTKYAEAENFGGEKVEMYSFEYDEANPFKAVRALKYYYYEKNIDLIIGASLGGFIAASCEFARRIVVNPCWSPSVELPKIGYSDSVKDYEALEKSLGRFAEDEDGELCIGCFATEDEILGNKYRDNFGKSFKETYDIPGGHHLSEEAAKMIMTEIAPMLIERFKTCEGVGQITGNGLNETQRLLYAHMFSIYNEDSIKKSEKCGCFYCMEVFPTSMVEDFAIEPGNNPNTALCPYCMIDSILAEADWKDLSPEFLRKMYDYFF
jgi:predicted esterase YcpF (UPF0227 family)